MLRPEARDSVRHFPISGDLLERFVRRQWALSAESLLCVMKRQLHPSWQRCARHCSGIRLLCLVLFLIAVHTQMAEDQSPAPRRDINAVLRDHDKELLAIKGVVGVYVGLQKDGRTPCLYVMLARDAPETRKAIPSEIEGYRVLVDITGEIRPLPGQSPAAPPR